MSTNVTCSVITGIDNCAVPDKLTGGSPVRFVWSNIDFRPDIPAGDDPVTLILKLLMSTGSTPANWGGTGTNYDALEPGVGLGIPRDMIDVDGTFATVSQTRDYIATAPRIGYAFIEPFPAKDFIEQELCRPFGWYLSTGSDGKIRLIQPRHPQKFYIGANCFLPLYFNGGLGGAPDVPLALPVGVFDAYELCLEVNNQLSRIGAPPGFISYSNHQFVMPAALPSGTKLTIVGDVSSAWPSLGFSDTQTADPDGKFRSVPIGALSADVTSSRRLTEADMTGVEVLDNRRDQVSNVIFEYWYDYYADRYYAQHGYGDPNVVDFSGSLNAPDHRIRTKSIGMAVSPNATMATQMLGFKPASTTCSPAVLYSDPARNGLNGNPTGNPGLGQSYVKVDPDAWAQLVAFSLMDRYRQPPIKFRARLNWKWNTLQTGDLVLVNYSRPGVFTDFERKSDVLVDRLFEVTELNVHYNGTIDATFLGHRYVSY